MGIKGVNGLGVLPFRVGHCLHAFEKSNQPGAQEKTKEKGGDAGPRGAEGDVTEDVEGRMKLG